MSDRSQQAQKSNKGKKNNEAPKETLPAVVEKVHPEVSEDVRNAALTILAEHEGCTVEELMERLEKKEVSEDKLSTSIEKVLNHQNNDKPHDDVDEGQTQITEDSSAKSENLQGKAKVIHDILTARIERVKDTKGEGPAKKFETERQKLIAHAAFFEAHPDINLGGLDKIAIYAMQKVRKIITGDIDGFTMTILQNVDALKKEKVPFTAELQMAAMSNSVFKNAKDGNKDKLKVRRECDPATASTQTSSSRAALCFLGVATEAKGRNQALEVNTGHPIWKEKIAPVLRALAKQSAAAANAS